LHADPNIWERVVFFLWKEARAGVKTERTGRTGAGHPKTREGEGGGPEMRGLNETGIDGGSSIFALFLAPRRRLVADEKQLV